MKKNIDPFNKLTKKELLHLLNTIVPDDPMAAFIRTRAEHLKMEKANPKIVACLECRHIARKLGLET